MTFTLHPSIGESLPEWHYQPLHLNTEQMKNPQKLIDEFFELYGLPDIRHCLNEWYMASLYCTETAESLPDRFHLYLTLLQFCEAVWVDRKQQAKQLTKTC